MLVYKMIASRMQGLNNGKFPRHTGLELSLLTKWPRKGHLQDSRIAQSVQQLATASIVWVSSPRVGEIFRTHTNWALSPPVSCKLGTHGYLSLWLSGRRVVLIGHPILVQRLTHWHTQPAVRWSDPSMSFAFNSSLLLVDGMTCLIPFESWWNALLKINFAWIKYKCTKLPFSPKN